MVRRSRLSKLLSLVQKQLQKYNIRDVCDDGLKGQKPRMISYRKVCILILTSDVVPHLTTDHDEDKN